MSQNEKIRRERKHLYFDLICGIINSTFAIIAIIFTTIVYGLRNIPGFYVGLIFSIFYLGVSIFLIILGIYTGRIEKKYGIVGKKKKKREIKPPIVS
jgi:MFS family permease